MSFGDALLWAHIQLLTNLVMAEPKLRVDREVIELHVRAAIAASDDVISPELLLAIGREEAHFRNTDVSRTRNKKGQLSLFCGVTQAAAKGSWSRCKALQDPFVAYAQTVKELKTWRKAAKGNVRRMLAGYGCGTKMSLKCGSYGGRKVPYPARVLKRMKQYQKKEKKHGKEASHEVSRASVAR